MKKKHKVTRSTFCAPKMHAEWRKRNRVWFSKTVAHSVNDLFELQLPGGDSAAVGFGPRRQNSNPFTIQKEVLSLKQKMEKK